MNLDGLHEMVKELGSTYVTRVGILGGKNARPDGEFGNADIGFVHEMGSESQNILARSFLRMPLELKKQELMKAFDSSTMRQAIEGGEYKKAYAILGVFAEGIIQQAFSTGGFGQWKTLDQKTVDRKGSSAILIDSAELRKAQSSDVVKRSELT